MSTPVDCNDKLINFIKNVREKVKLYFNAINSREIYRRVVYTAIIGGSDTLNDPLPTINNSEFICFTDNKNLKSEAWIVIYVGDVEDIDPYMAAKAIKVLGANLLDMFAQSIWIDGSILLKHDPWNLISENIGKGKVLFFSHPNRNCVYQEIAECLIQRKGNFLQLDDYKTQLVAENYPLNNGLIAGGFIYRVHTAEVALLFSSWMDHISRYSTRDQLTFNYICWKQNFDIYYINEDIFRNKHFVTMPHTTGLKNKLKRVAKYWLIKVGWHAKII